MAGTRNKQVGTIEYKPANITVPYTFDSKEKTFHAAYTGTPYQHEQARELEAIVLTAIKDSLHVTWLPIIEITPVYQSMLASFPDEVVLGFALDRRFVASFRNGYQQVHWDCLPGDRLQVCSSFGWDETKDGSFTLPTYRLHHKQIRYYHEYSETLWNQLQSFREIIGLLRAQFLTALQTEAEIATFSAAFVGLLAPQQSVTGA
jgi:hypothetical protein